MLDSDKVCAQHLREVAIHEVCHAFAVLPRCEGLMLTLNLNRCYEHLAHQKMWDGQVTVRVLDDDKYQDSIYGWAGIVGEAIVQDRAKAVEHALERYRSRRRTVSDTDLMNIESVEDALRPKSAQAAYDLLHGRWAEIEDIHRQAVAFIEEKRLSKFVTGWMKMSGWLPIE